MKFIELIFEGREDDFKSTYANKFSPEKLEAIINMVNEVPNGTKFLIFLGKVLPKKVKNFEPPGTSLTILIIAPNFSGENLLAYVALKSSSLPSNINSINFISYKY